MNLKTKLSYYRSIWKDISYDYSKRLKYSLTPFNQSKENLEAEIMLIMHPIEKGLCFPTKRNGWGKEKVLILINKINCYISKYGINEIISTAINILNQYINSQEASKDEKIQKEISNLVLHNSQYIKQGIGGSKIVEKPSFKFTETDLLNFFKQRSSVRFYSDNPITQEEINKVLSFAKTTPSACNRQTSRVYIFTKKEQIKSIIDCQFGDQGWCNNATALFIVTSDISYFNATHERAQPYIDGGMYAMNVMMGLHAQKIASCFKEYIRIPSSESLFYQLSGIKDNEIPIVLILAGHYKNESTLSPISHRLNL